MVLAFVYLEHKQISLKQINQEIILVDYSLCLQLGLIYPVQDRLARNYIPCLGQRGQKPYPDQRHIPI